MHAWRSAYVPHVLSCLYLSPCDFARLTCISYPVISSAMLRGAASTYFVVLVFISPWSCPAYHRHSITWYHVIHILWLLRTISPQVTIHHQADHTCGVLALATCGDFLVSGSDEGIKVRAPHRYGCIVLYRVPRSHVRTPVPVACGTQFADWSIDRSIVFFLTNFFFVSWSLCPSPPHTGRDSWHAVCWFLIDLSIDRPFFFFLPPHCRWLVACFFFFHLKQNVASRWATCSTYCSWWK